jgi:hypothetical protein
MMFHSEFKYDCCGFIYKWEFCATKTYTSGTFDAQTKKKTQLTKLKKMNNTDPTKNLGWTQVYIYTLKSGNSIGVIN